MNIRFSSSVGVEVRRQSTTTKSLRPRRAAIGTSSDLTRNPLARRHPAAYL
jgi:hypothetical protein